MGSPSEKASIHRGCVDIKWNGPMAYAIQHVLHIKKYIEWYNHIINNTEGTVGLTNSICSEPRHQQWKQHVQLCMFDLASSHVQIELI